MQGMRAVLFFSPKESKNVGSYRSAREFRAVSNSKITSVVAWSERLGFASKKSDTLQNLKAFGTRLYESLTTRCSDAAHQFGEKHWPCLALSQRATVVQPLLRALPKQVSERRFTEIAPCTCRSWRHQERCTTIEAHPDLPIISVAKVETVLHSRIFTSSCKVMVSIRTQPLTLTVIQ